MRKILKSADEVMHYWANQVQSEGRAGNVYFRGAELYSYGAHFCIARILPSGVVAFTTRSYSPTTSYHVWKARSAARNRSVVFCNDPSDDARDNMAQARREVADTLQSSTRARIRQTTRVKLKAHAFYLGEQANEYLAALPADEQAGNPPIDLSKLDSMREELASIEQAQAQLLAEQAAARAESLKESLADWRAHRIIARSGLYELPVALRLKTVYHDSTGHAYDPPKQVVETSHGADIPAEHARRLWPQIERTRRQYDRHGDWVVDTATPGARVGAYKRDRYAPMARSLSAATISPMLN